MARTVVRFGLISGLALGVSSACGSDDDGDDLRAVCEKSTYCEHYLADKEGAESLATVSDCMDDAATDYGSKLSEVATCMRKFIDLSCEDYFDRLDECEP